MLKFSKMGGIVLAKVYRLAGKIYLVQKKHLKTAFLSGQNRPHLTLGGPGGQTVDTRSSFGAPLKTLGYNESN